VLFTQNIINFEADDTDSPEILTRRDACLQRHLQILRAVNNAG